MGQLPSVFSIMSRVACLASGGLKFLASSLSRHFSQQTKKQNRKHRIGDIAIRNRIRIIVRTFHASSTAKTDRTMISGVLGFPEAKVTMIITINMALRNLPNLIKKASPMCSCMIAY